MIIAQVCLRLATTKGHSEMCSFITQHNATDSPSCLKSNVTIPQSVMIWGCNVICWCWSIVFFENQRHSTRLPRTFGALHASFCWPAYFIFQQDLAPAHTAKSTKSWLNDHGVDVLDWQANSPDLNPIENLWGIVKSKMRNKRTKKCRWAEGHCQRNLGFHTISAVPQTDHAELRQ